MTNEFRTGQQVYWINRQTGKRTLGTITRVNTITGKHVTAAINKNNRHVVLPVELVSDATVLMYDQPQPAPDLELQGIMRDYVADYEATIEATHAEATIQFGVNCGYIRGFHSNEEMRQALKDIGAGEYASLVG